MNDELTKITLTFPILCGRPNCNGTIFTEKTIRNAFVSSNPHMPIIMEDGTSRVTLTGRSFNMAPSIVINEIHDCKITDFEIKSVSIIKERIK